MATFTGNAVIAARHFTGDAVIIGARWRHDRELDHSGTQDDTTVVLSEDIGPYPAGTTLHDYLVGLTERITSLENNTRYWGTFTGNAVLAAGGAFTGNAVISARRFTGDAAIKRTMADNFSGDAVIVAHPSFTGNAFIV